MLKPAILTPNEEVTTIGRVFEAPLVVKGLSWLPINQVWVWGLMAWLAGKKHPERTCGERLGIGGLQMIVMLGSEWCHNLAHAAAARRVGRPMDAIRVVLGMPLVVYFDVNEPTVRPRQHITRALGGPLFNALLIPLAWLGGAASRSGSARRDVAQAALWANLFIVAAGLLPIPVLDGGAVLKWSLVERGYNLKQADQLVMKANRLTGAGLGAAAAIALRKKQRFAGIVLAFLAAISLAFGLGLVKEQG
jgi:Zn-dependent protease